MGEVMCRLTVFFQDPFWEGVFEHIEDGKLSAAKVTFGAEPKDYEVYDFLMRHYAHLKFSQMENTGIGTKSQQALKLQQEQGKAERRSKSREQKLAEAERMFELKQQKKKDKHKGH